MDEHKQDNEQNPKEECALTGWIQLIESTDIFDKDNVDRLLRKIGTGDENYECAAVLWNEEFTALMKMNVFYWDGVMFDFASELDDVAARLMSNEYILFEEKVNHVHKPGCSTRIILVRKDSVEFLCTEPFINELRSRVQNAGSLPMDGEVPGREIDIG